MAKLDRVIKDLAKKALNNIGYEIKLKDDKPLL